MQFLRKTWTVLKTTIQNYQRDRVQPMGAVLAYYTIFSLPAMIIIIVGLVGFFFGEDAVQGRIYGQLHEFIGDNAAHQVEDAVKSVGSPKESWWATMIGLAFLLFVATGIFFVLQEALNTVFHVQTVRPKMGILWFIVNRVISFGMILTVCAFFVVTVVLNTVILQVSNWIGTNESWLIAHMPPKLDFLNFYISYFTGYFLKFLKFATTIFLMSLFFALLYYVLPAVKLRWRHIWAGSLFAAILFWVGQVILGYYLSYVSVVSAYGAAGSLIVLLLWVYYSAQLIFLGAEYIKALAKLNEVALHPKPFARFMQARRETTTDIIMDNTPQP